MEYYERQICVKTIYEQQISVLLSIRQHNRGMCYYVFGCGYKIPFIAGFIQDINDVETAQRIAIRQIKKLACSNRLYKIYMNH